MSVSFSAYAVLGIKVPAENLVTTKRVKIGRPDLPDDFEFHPKTGAPLWKEEETWLIEQGEDVYKKFGVCWDHDYENAYIGWVIEQGQYDDVPFRSIARWEEDLLMKLQEDPIWELRDGPFGMRAVLYVS